MACRVKESKERMKKQVYNEGIRKAKTVYFV